MSVLCLILVKCQRLDFKNFPARLGFLVINVHADRKRDDMKHKRIAADLMEKFLTTQSNAAMSMREQYLMRETIHSLMRLDQSEQSLEMRHSLNKLIPASMRPLHVRRNTTRATTQDGSVPVLRPLAFGRD